MLKGFTTLTESADDTTFLLDVAITNSTAPILSSRKVAAQTRCADSSDLSLSLSLQTSVPLGTPEEARNTDSESEREAISTYTSKASSESVLITTVGGET